MSRIAGSPKSAAAAACGALALLSSAAAAPAAQAADSYVSRTAPAQAPTRFTVGLRAEAGRSNAARFAVSGSTIAVRDGPGGVRAARDGGCAQIFVPIPVPRAVVHCALAGVETLHVELGDGDDSSVNATAVQSYNYGGPGNDHIVGGSADDWLQGDEGDDVLEGNDGDFDAFSGGPGNDLLSGGNGRDSMAGGEGNDTHLGGPGPDELQHSPGADDFSGGTDPAGALPESVDYVTYQFAKQPLSISLDGQANDGAAGEGDNVRSDVERILGGDVDDRISGSGDANEISGHWGDDRIEGRGGDDALSGSDGQDAVRGGDGADELRGGGGDDELVGEAGDDLLHGDDPGRRGADTMRGGDGIDTVSYAEKTAPVSVDFDGAADDGTAGEADNAGVDVENAIGGTGADALLGDARANALTGGAGGDAIDGGEGVDALAGEDGDDTITSRDGSADTVACGAGADTVVADATDTIAPDCETVQLPQAPTPQPDPQPGTPQPQPGTPDPQPQPGTPQPQPGTPQPQTTPVASRCAALTVATRRVVVGAKGVAKIRLSAARGSAATCTARITLRAGRSIGSATARIAPGKQAVIAVRLARSVRMRLARARVGIATRISVTTVDATGRSAARIGASVHLAAKPRRSA